MRASHAGEGRGGGEPRRRLSVRPHPAPNPIKGRGVRVALPAPLAGYGTNTFLYATSICWRHGRASSGRLVGSPS
ncbi:hypothetical protein MTBUT4_140035 [Magnetospirillum sp. UT-4]|nr:hypothetical protein MTBUT4_140035 [Magnetospirillum sp. UT-4]